MTIDHRFKPHLTELQDCSTYHSLKSKIITNVYRLFLGNVFSSINKTNSVSFRICACHTVNLILTETVHKFCNSCFICRNIFSIPVQITQIWQIRIHYDSYSKIQLRINRFRNPLFHHILTIVIHIRTQHIFHIFYRWQFTIFKSSIYFKKKFCCHCIIPDFFFICIGTCSTKFCVKKCKCPSIFTEFFFCVCRIPVTVCIILRKQFFIKFCIFFLQFFYGKLFFISFQYDCCFLQKSRHILKEIQKIRLYSCFSTDFDNSIFCQIIAFFQQFIHFIISSVWI